MTEQVDARPLAGGAVREPLDWHLLIPRPRLLPAADRHGRSVRRTLDRASFPGKRALDLLLGSLLLALALPLLALTALMVKLDDLGPVLYRQSRVGRDGQPFEILKFRTMVVGADAHQTALSSANVTDGLLFKVRGDPRVTRVGQFLRRTSLDELPQLVNVLRGQMSLVGPRPLAVDPDAFTPREHLRHVTRPGITGLWQVSGGNHLSYAEMIELDLAYLTCWSIALDLRLLLRTARAVLHRRRVA